jgi:calmodulin
MLDSQLEDIFGTSDLNSGRTLSLTEFLHCLHTHQVKQLNNKVTSKTYKPNNSSGTQQAMKA